MVDVFSLEGSSRDLIELPKEQKKIYVGIDKEIELKKDELSRLTNVIENVKVSEKLRSKINKDFASGLDNNEILKDCLKCISLMTGDTVFYNQNIKYLNK